MNPFSAVLVGHLIGDWIVQTDWQAYHKEFSWKANQQHMLGYHLTLAIFCMFAMPWLVLLIVLIVSWFTHSIIDRRWPVKKLMRVTGSGPFSETTFGIIAVDQSLHLSILLILAGIV